MAFNNNGQSPSSNDGAVPSCSSSGPGNENSEPVYNLEHLATFSVTPENGIVYPADGMRRLLQLEKSNGIWSQKMQLRLERTFVIIMDNETKAIMEKFPPLLIKDPTAFTSRDPMEMYNNILVFTVADDSDTGQHAEMHIFQCQSISALDLVEDLKLLQAGKLVPGDTPRGPRNEIPPPPSLPPPRPPVNGINVRERVTLLNASRRTGGCGTSRDVANDGGSSTISEKYEREVTVLNHCFDDIEKFISRLQHAAAASRELERRKRTNKSRRRNLGDGMLTMRAKQPPEMEFVDIFQKFKLSFNLLAKLKSHIHDPNAPELIHFLFTPLALIVEASRDINGDPNFPNKIVSPLLTREAMNLLMNCVTSKETELWHSLGDTWLVPRDQWRGHIPPYHPIFTDGWSPESPATEESPKEQGDQVVSLCCTNKKETEELPEQSNDPYFGPGAVEESHYSGDYLEYETQEEHGSDYFDRNYGAGSELYGKEERDQRSEQTRAHSDISMDSMEGGARGGQGITDAQEAWLDELLSIHGRIVRVTYPRAANNEKELSVLRGEYLEVLEDSRKWWKARNSRGEIGHVPNTIVVPHGTPHSEDDVFDNPLYAGSYPRQEHGEYSFEDTELEGPSTSRGTEASHRPHAIPPPAPADWVRKERLGKKDCRGCPEASSDHNLPSTSIPGSQRSRRSRSQSSLRAKLPSPLRHRTGSYHSSTEFNGIPLPPPPPLLPTPPPPPSLFWGTTSYKFENSEEDKCKKSSIATKQSPTQHKKSLQQLYYEELKTALKTFGTRQKVKSQSKLYLGPRFTPSEVQRWLEEQKFPQCICNYFKNMNGTDVFKIPKGDIEKHFGPVDGKKLEELILLSRDATIGRRSRANELSKGGQDQSKDKSKKDPRPETKF